jgi:hypothetical protein
MVVLALLFAIQAHWTDPMPTHGWIFVGASDDNAVFIQPGPRPTLHWRRLELRRAQSTGLRSVRSLIQVDCAGGRSRSIQRADYSQPNLDGPTMATDSSIGDWTYDGPGTLGGSFLEEACR